MLPDISKILADAEPWRAKLQNRTRPDSWYSISNAATDRATIRIYDEISWWGVDALGFAEELDAVTAGEIEVCINSPGGNVFDGLAIFNALRTHPARIVTRVDGLAASAASFIAQAGDERIMVASSQMMIHDAWGYMAGNAAELRDYADFLERQTANIADLYAARADRDAAYFADLMSAETWMTADEAVDHGLADRVFTPERASDASNKTSTDTPDEPAASAAGSPAADVVQAATAAVAIAEHSLAVSG